MTGNNNTTMLKDKNFDHILLWMPTWIGDVCLTFPALHSLRAKYPSARITAVVRAPANEILMGHPAIDTVIQIPFASGAGVLEKIRFGRKLKKYAFDLAVVFPNSLQSAILVFLSGASVRLGYNTEGRGWLLTHPEPMNSHNKRNQNRVDYFVNILQSLQCPGLPKDCEPPGPQPGDRSIENLLAAMDIAKDERLIAVHPVASKPERSWHVERFGELCRNLLARENLTVVLLGTQGERSQLEKIKIACSGLSIKIIPKMNLREIAAVLNHCCLFIGNDSGMMHLAAMVDTPAVGIFGPGNPATSGPQLPSERKILVTRDYACSPCRQRFFKECEPSENNKPFCLEDIQVEEVFQAVERLLLSSIEQD